MAGTLIVDEIKSGTTAPPAIKRSDGAVVGEVCRSRVEFNGTGTVAIGGSMNVSSLTDLGVGQYQVNFAFAASVWQYSPAVASGNADTTHAAKVGGLGVGSYSIYVTDMSGNAFKDASVVSGIVFGGQS